MKAKKQKRDIDSIILKPVIEMDVSLARESAWDNVICRHINTAPVTTWTTRKQALGTYRVCLLEIIMFIFDVLYNMNSSFRIWFHNLPFL